MVDEDRLMMSCIGSIACYDNLEKVGEGTYGYVFKARDKRDGSVVALKRLTEEAFVALVRLATDAALARETHSSMQL